MYGGLTVLGQSIIGSLQKNQKKKLQSKYVFNTLQNILFYYYCRLNILNNWETTVSLGIGYTLW